jgi:uncharacterized protein YbbC (DUF1343 family)
MTAKVQTGLDVLASQQFATLHGKRIGVLVNQTSVDVNLHHLIDLLKAAPKVQLSRIFTPEHGLFAHAQDQVAVSSYDGMAEISTVSLYGDSEQSLWPALDTLTDLDLLIIDMQDIGSRYYTYAATMGFCLERAAQAGLSVMVLDRPNPIGGERIQGPMLRPELKSFVGWYRLPVRHGLTMGELALHIVREAGITLDLEIVKMNGWHRKMWFDDCGLPWVLPSPNMPTLDTAVVYPGGCLLEGTNWSEGRGTTRPFELFGSPTLDAIELKARMDSEKLLGVAFRVHQFEPTFHKHAGKICQGLQVHVLDRNSFRPWMTYLCLLMHGRSSDPGFEWRQGIYEFVSDRLAIDLLLGDFRVRESLENGEERETLEHFEREGEQEFASVLASLSLYPD